MNNICILRKNKKKELPYDLAIPHLGIYLDKTIIQRDKLIPMFTEALFTIAKTMEIHYPLTQEWTKKMWYLYPKEYYPAIKK